VLFMAMVDRRFRLARKWSNRELRRIAPCFRGNIVNVSAWDDRDKEGGHYRDYFTGAASYSCTNYPGYRGFQNLPGEHLLDLTGALPPNLRRRFDVALNHTTLEHIFDVTTAFANLCELSDDVVIVVVPFAQMQHDADSWQDYWRFTPAGLRKLFEHNGLTVIYEAASPLPNAPVYLLFVAARRADKWAGVLPAYEPVREAGSWIGGNVVTSLADRLRRLLRAHRHDGV
jgi:hypothetical protein